MEGGGTAMPLASTVEHVKAGAVGVQQGTKEERKATAVPKRAPGEGVSQRGPLACSLPVKNLPPPL